MALLEIKNVTFTYPGANAPAVQNASLCIGRGELVTLFGPTGSGKSTLLRLMKNELRPAGRLEGQILFKGQSLLSLPAAVTAPAIGYVGQRPQQQLVTDEVWHELAFGLENMHTPPEEIRRRVAEVASFFGIEHWFERKTASLSGGQKQLLNLAAVMVMQPELLLLDEPTAQLDPIAASDFLHTLQRLNRETGVTVVLSEHRLQEAIPLSDSMMLIEAGRITPPRPVRECVEALPKDSPLLAYMPAAVQLYHRFSLPGPCPLTIREGKSFIEAHFQNRIPALPLPQRCAAARPALQMDRVCFRYAKDAPDVLRSFSLKVYENEFFCLLGGNGAGKSTALSCAAALLRPYSGSIRVFGIDIKKYKNGSLYQSCLSLLPQDVQTVFLHDTVEQELARTDASLLPYDLSACAAQHPYDLSGGQQQLLALAAVLSGRPRLLLLDEPTKGLDAGAVQALIGILKALQQRGMTIVCVTHDPEFAAMAADRCALIFRGEIVSLQEPRRFFSGNSFYTTAVQRMTRGYYQHAVTVQDAFALMTQNGRKTE